MSTDDAHAPGGDAQTPALASPALAATTTPTIAATTPPDYCRSADGTVRLTPAAPGGGEMVAVRGAGLPAGSYLLTLATYPGDGVWLSNYAIGSAGVDGVLDASFVMPPGPEGTCLLAILRGSASASAVSHPFRTSPNRAVPGRCEDLPDAAVTGVRVSLTPPPIGRGAEVDVVPPVTWGFTYPEHRIGAFANLYFGSPTDRPVELRTTAEVSDGQLTGRVSLPERAEWSGKCVEVEIVELPTGTPDRSYTLLTGRFNYP